MLLNEVVVRVEGIIMGCYDELFYINNDDPVVQKGISYYKGKYSEKSKKQLEMKLGDLLNRFYAIMQLLEERA